MLAGSIPVTKKLTFLNVRVVKFCYHYGYSNNGEVEVEVSTGFDDSTAVPGLDVGLFWGTTILQSAKTDEYGLASLHYKGINLATIKTGKDYYYTFNSDSKQLRVRVKGYALTADVPWPSIEFKQGDAYTF